MIKNYSQILTPFRLNIEQYHLTFRDKKKEELDDFCKWYVDSIHDRIEILERAVKTIPDFKIWKADYSPESLKLLEDWFKEVITSREISEEENYKIWGNGPNLNKLSGFDDKTLTEETVSIAIDIGMYLSQVFLKNNPKLRWEFVTKKKTKSMDYGQPVLVGFRNNMTFEPTGMMLSHAFGYSRGDFKRSLKDLYDIWVKMIE